MNIARVIVQKIEDIRTVVFDPSAEFSSFNVESGVAKIRMKPSFGKLLFGSAGHDGGKIYFMVDWGSRSLTSENSVSPGDATNLRVNLRVSAYTSGAYYTCCMVEFAQDMVFIKRTNYVPLFYRSSLRPFYAVQLDFNSPAFVERFLGTIAEFGVGSLVVHDLNSKRFWRRYRRDYLKSDRICHNL